MRKPSSVIVLEIGLVTSSAWLSLSGAAVHVYLIFRTKCQISKRIGKPGRHERVIVNNGTIEFTYLEAEKKYGISKDRFTRALDQLIDRGFIDVRGSGMGVHKVKTWYAISDRWRDHGTPAFCAVTRPGPNISNQGFRKGNQLWRRAARGFPSGEFTRDSTREKPRGDEKAMRKNRRGDTDPFLMQDPERQGVTV